MGTIIQNKKARFDFDILEEFQAGAELLGHEVKALKSGKGSLVGARVLIRGGEAFLVGATIEPYQPQNVPEGYDPDRPRRLLISKKELAKLTRSEDEKGLTIVPISWYNEGRLLKLSFGIGKGKKKTDKRETIKERDTSRELARELKRR